MDGTGHPGKRGSTWPKPTLKQSNTTRVMVEGSAVSSLDSPVDMNEAVQSWCMSGWMWQMCCAEDMFTIWLLAVSVYLGSFVDQQADKYKYRILYWAFTHNMKEMSQNAAHFDLERTQGGGNSGRGYARVDGKATTMPRQCISSTELMWFTCGRRQEAPSVTRLAGSWEVG